MSKDWFDKYNPIIPPEFEQWWLSFYGKPEDYNELDHEQDEYWVRKGFALNGWRAARAEK